MKVVGLFAGIGGIESGFEQSGGFQTDLLCESWEPARQVLAHRFGRTRDEIHDDVANLRDLPIDTDVVAAGFPCTDLSQAGRTAGIGGAQSGLVAHVFRLLRRRSQAGKLRWLVIENVPNMLQLDRGRAMRFLVDEIESLGMRWAYRVVDSRFTGVPQRRRRVVLVASSADDPRSVLFADEVEPPTAERYRTDAFGFYWTEGRTGLGWAQDAVPTLKGGSTVGIPSPPAVWFPNNPSGRRLVLPSISDAEALQGFPRGWTEAADRGQRNGPRWRLVGNAVTVGVAQWLGTRLQAPGDWIETAELWDGPASWPTAAFGNDGKVWRVEISEFPTLLRYHHLSEVMDRTDARPLSARATRGFWSRLQDGNLGRYPEFRSAVAEHLDQTA